MFGWTRNTHSKFESFCVEVGFDSLTFHNGPDETYPQIGPAWSGTGLPDPVSISSGCLTLHFVSDANVSCTGWEAHWTTEVIPPVPPQITAVLPVPACSSQTTTLNLSKPIHCDSVYASAFELDGVLPQNIIQANPLNCNGDSTQQIQLTLAQGLNLGGIYELSFTTHYRDACDSIWTFVSMDEINVIDCPIVVELIATQDTICAGNCTQITAIVNGGDGNYSFVWNGITASGPGPVTACPPANQLITLTVDDTSPAAPASGTVFITVVAPAVLPPSSSHCQSEEPFLLSATPAGGTWFGTGITDESGVFNGDSALAGSNTLFYVYQVFPQLNCTTSTQITVLPIDAGFDQAACPGSDPFMLLGFSPAGGSWTGPQVTTSGIFDPLAVGEYVVTYNVNGCSEDLTVFVDNISQNPVFADSVCQSDAADTLIISPPGGRWRGEGIVDSLAGIFDPGETDAGLITLQYVLNGCSRDVQIYVKEIWAGWNITACPTQDPFELEDFAPPGGSWSGTGITSASPGIFNPGDNSGEAFNSDIIYSHPNGCSDTARVWVFYTSIGADTLVFCSGNEGILLNHDELDTDPWEGVWSGNGVINGNDPDLSEFVASSAGNGLHYLVFEENTCADTVIFIVQQAFLEDLPSVCEEAPPVDIPVPDFAAGGNFQGDGILQPSNTQFNPGAAGEGSHQLIYTSPDGCRDTISVDVIEFIQAELDASSAPLCFTDTLIQIDIFPQDAVLSGNGIVEPQFFNPALAGEGPHLLSLTTGEGFCMSTDTLTVFVAPSIGYSLFVSKDTLCFGDFTSILVNAYGGNGNLITYTWDNGLPPLQQQIISPQISTEYHFQISDGCALIRDTVNIVVQPEIDFTVSFSEPACYGEDGFASIGGVHGGEYLITWRQDVYGMNTDLPGLSSNTYQAVISDTSSGCSVDTSLTIPGYPLVQALFVSSPNVDCIPFDQDSIRFIDLSTGAFSGSWNFGDGAIIPYTPGTNPAHDYSTHGQYQVVLEVSDTNGCSSKLEKLICIQEPFRIYMPSAITVNGDLMNDQLFVYGYGIKHIDLYVYNRRGDEIWHGKDNQHMWDGKYAGREVPSGVYAYIVEVQWVDDSTYSKAGTITVIR
ncbi:MAG: gliding motility-associated C-terminal domain-containing protein [Bacteroidia bacterium]